MTIQEAYNKGLDDAESLVLSKMTNAVNHVDDGPFLNPSLEELRQTILNRIEVVPDNSNMVSVLKSIIKGKEYEFEGDTEDTLVLKFYYDLIKHLRSPNGRTSVFSTKAKTMLSKVEYDLTMVKDVVNYS